MFMLSIYYPRLRYSQPRRAEMRKASVLTHLPTGRQWRFPSKKAGMEALAAFTAATREGRMSVLPVEPVDAEPVAA